MVCKVLLQIYFIFTVSFFLVSLSKHCINKQKQNSPTLKLVRTVAIGGTNFAEPVECLHLTGALV